MNFQAKLKQIRELAGLDENVKSLLEKMTGKELVSYEGIDALVAALMTFYNGELKKKISVTEFNEKFKNFCPYAIGDIYLTTNSNNPSSKYLGTTWQKIEGRFLLGTSSSQASKLTGGSMSKTIAKANLPNIKIPIDSFNLTVQPHTHGIASYVTVYSTNGGWKTFRLNDDNSISGAIQSLSSGSSTGSASPQTNSLGSGQALDITPAYYTTHMWLRTS